MIIAKNIAHIAIIPMALELGAIIKLIIPHINNMTANNIVPYLANEPNIIRTISSGLSCSLFSSIVIK